MNLFYNPGYSTPVGGTFVFGDLIIELETLVAINLTVK